MDLPAALRVSVALLLLALGGCASAGSPTVAPSSPGTEQYVGAYQNGLRSGEGTYTWPDGRRYAGSFRDGLPNGRGTYTLPNGEKYVGEFQDNKRTQGTYTWRDGRQYVGTFRDDKPDGTGTYTWPDGKKYVGDFRGGRADGRGVYSWPDGRRYEGELGDDVPNGRGTYTFADGRVESGAFRNGDFVGASSVTRVAAASTAVIPANAGEVPLDRRGGTFIVSGLVNGSLALDFYLDSGSADVSLPVYAFEALKRAGSIRPDDVLGSETYMMSNGASRKAVIFQIRSLTVGTVTLENVRGSLSEIDGPPLLGMSFLGRFASWSVDNGRKVLILR